jgi:hypothetical protein
LKTPDGFSFHMMWWNVSMPPHHCMQPTPQPVITLANINVPPVWYAADAGG